MQAYNIINGLEKIEDIGLKIRIENLDIKFV